MTEIEETLSGSIQRTTDHATANPHEKHFDINLVIMQQVHIFIKEKRIYRDPYLTLESMACQMKIKRNYLSKAINAVTGMHFNRFINEFRVREAICILKNHKGKKILEYELMDMVGFNSRTAFYMSFKRLTGYSPTQYRDRINQRMNNINF